MFSSRTDWDLRPSPLFELLQQKRARGEKVIDLTDSNPTTCGLIDSSQELIDPDALKRSTVYEPDPKGLPHAREAVARWYGLQGKEVNPDHIILTSGTSEAYSFLLRLLCNVGDAVAVPKPGYPLFDYLARLNDVNCHHYDLVYDGEWHIDFTSFTESLLPDTKALVLVHPNNPTGSYIKRPERERILAAVSARAVPLIVDEVFSPFSFVDDSQRAETFAGTESALTFTVNGLSKLAGLPQMKLAWIVVSGPADEGTQALHRLEIISDTFLSVGTPVQQALPRLLSDTELRISKILHRVRDNYAQLSMMVKPDSPATLLRSEGGWNAILRLPEARSDYEWTHALLLEHGVLTHPGELFDVAMKSCVVVSLLPAEAVFAEGVRTILAAIGR